MNGVPNPHALKGSVLSLAACALALLAVAAGTALADTSDPQARPKPSSFAPHHDKSHVYGTPVSKPILRKRKKHPHPPPVAHGPAEPIK